MSILLTIVVAWVNLLNDLSMHICPLTSFNFISTMSDCELEISSNKSIRTAYYATIDVKFEFRYKTNLKSYNEVFDQKWRHFWKINRLNIYNIDYI